MYKLKYNIRRCKLYSDSKIENFKPDAFKNLIYKVTAN